MRSHDENDFTKVVTRLMSMCCTFGGLACYFIRVRVICRYTCFSWVQIFLVQSIVLNIRLTDLDVYNCLLCDILCLH